MSENLIFPGVVEMEHWHLKGFHFSRIDFLFQSFSKFWNPRKISIKIHDIEEFIVCTETLHVFPNSLSLIYPGLKQFTSR